MLWYVRFLAKTPRNAREVLELEFPRHELPNESENQHSLNPKEVLDGTPL